MAFDLLIRSGTVVDGAGPPPAVQPAGIAAVIVNGAVAVRGDIEIGVRPGRLLRRS